MAVLGVRLIGFWFVLSGILALLGNLVSGAGEFDPSYIVYFLRLVVFEPVIMIVGGLLVVSGSRTLGRLLAGRGRTRVDTIDDGDGA